MVKIVLTEDGEVVDEDGTAVRGMILMSGPSWTWVQVGRSRWRNGYLSKRLFSAKTEVTRFGQQSAS